MQLVETQSAVWPEYGGDFFPLGTNNNIYTSQAAPHPNPNPHPEPEP